MRSQLTALLALTLPFIANATSFVGCYSDPGSLVSQGSYTYQSDGYCMEVCFHQQKSVMATTAGNKCFCGDEVPASSFLVPKSECDIPCIGFPSVMCGGDDAWSVYAHGSQESASNSSSATTTRASTSSSATSDSTNVSVTESATGTLEPSTASVSLASASATTSTSGASRRYGFF